MGRDLTVLGLIPRAFPLEGRRATFFGAFAQYLYTSLMRAAFLYHHLYFNVAEPSYTLQKAVPRLFSSYCHCGLHKNAQQLFVFLFHDPL